MIEDLLKKRSNITFFSKTKIPEKKQIEEILEKAHVYTPHKNNFWHYDLYVYGPEHTDSKRNLALSSVCNSHKDFYKDRYSKNNVTAEDWEKLKRSYQDWLDYWSGDKTKEYVMKDKWHFNEQVTAPYLLAYYPAKTKARPSQVETEYFQKRAEKVFYRPDKVWQDQFNQQCGMHAMVTSMLALEKGLEVSFCKCYFYNENIHSDITLKSGSAFLLGIGYKDETKTQHDIKCWITKPKLDEVVKWL